MTTFTVIRNKQELRKLPSANGIRRKLKVIPGDYNTVRLVMGIIPLYKTGIDPSPLSRGSGPPVLQGEILNRIESKRAPNWVLEPWWSNPSFLSCMYHRRSGNVHPF
jgi:hypothetical protein